MAIHRKAHNLFLVSREVAEDSNLSASARGVLWYLLAQSDQEEILTEQIVSAFKQDNLFSILGALTELEANGYITRQEDGVAAVFEERRVADE